MKRLELGATRTVLKYRKFQELGMSENIGTSEEAKLSTRYGSNCRAKRACQIRLD